MMMPEEIREAITDACKDAGIDMAAHNEGDFLSIAIAIHRLRADVLLSALYIADRLDGLNARLE